MSIRYAVEERLMRLTKSEWDEMTEYETTFLTQLQVKLNEINKNKNNGGNNKSIISGFCD